jgi:ADP-ribosylglycohydrolase
MLGILLGTAAGDRIGGPVRMALHVAESLIERQRFDPQDLLTRYLAWYREGAFDTGPVAGRVLELISAGMAPAEAVEAVHIERRGYTAGCNAAHRIAPLAMAAFIPNEGLACAAQHEAALTHRHPLAGDVAAAVAVLCRQLALGVPWQASIARAAAGRLPETADALRSESPRSLLKPRGHAPEVLRAAVHFVGRSADFQTALREALRFAGPPNYAPVLVGAIAGARWGEHAIPPEELAHCPVRERLWAAAERLASGWGQIV